MKKIIPLICLFTALYSYGQGGYTDSLNKFIDGYIKNHEVVLGKDRALLRFYPVNANYKVTARFEDAADSKWFSMETSGGTKTPYRVYGSIHFSLHDTLVKLNIYQSQNLLAVTGYKDYLFIPFTDLSSGEGTYEGGRYIDLRTGDIVNHQLVLDFNKAYNPYCAYVTGKYNCPIPPKENYLPIAVLAGEKKFEK